jgi:DNA-binding response OmpR family regulator
VGLTIVVVDDDPSVSAMLDVVLKLEGHRVYMAMDGENAIELVRAEKPDVIVIDVMMPGVDGRQVARQLRATRAYDDVGIIFYTALEDDRDVWEGWLAGADSYVQKSADLEQLTAEILRVGELRTGRRLSAEEEPVEAEHV